MTRSLRLLATIATFATGCLGSAEPVLAQAVPPPAGCIGPASETWLTVAVQGVRNDRGLVAVTLYADNPSKFLAKHGGLYTVRVAAQAGNTTICLFVPTPATYALATYHDENASRHLDRSALGLPKEGFGFSNNASTFFGLPSFRAVRLAVPRAGFATQIKLRYP